MGGGYLNNLPGKAAQNQNMGEANSQLQVQQYFFLCGGFLCSPKELATASGHIWVLTYN